MAFLDRYKKGFKGDFTGGITAAIVAIPLGLGFGGLSGLGAEAGLYAAIILAIIASIIGGTQTLISDPTAPMAFVAGAIISTGMDVNGGVLGDHAWVHIILTFALAGLFQILFGKGVGTSPGQLQHHFVANAFQKCWGTGETLAAAGQIAMGSCRHVGDFFSHVFLPKAFKKTF